jgi:hypothetical protein
MMGERPAVKVVNADRKSNTAIMMAARTQK